MSRIGKKPVVVPDKVSVELTERLMSVKGPKGLLSERLPLGVTVSVESGQIVVVRNDESRQAKAAHGLARTLINNMVTGVTDGFAKELEIIGVGYRAEATSPTSLRLALGFSHPVMMQAPEGITFEVPVQTRVIVRGIDKEMVGQVAANIRSVRKPEPYKGKGVRYLGEKVLRKAGKTGKK
jgi:large subunit ribosomal protein L6